MKNILLLSAAMMLGTVSFAQDLKTSEVPSVVINTFNHSFPKATDVDWEMKSGLYNADFDLGREDHEVWIDAKGKIIRHKKDLLKSELPAVVANGIKSKYSSFRIDDIDRYEEGKQFYYKVELKKPGNELNLVFDAKGNQVDKRFH